MILGDKVAVIYGAGGAIGGAVGRTFAAEGAHVFLTGRRRAPVEVIVSDIVAGGSAEAAEVDACDEQCVDAHLESVVNTAGRVDISFNAIGIPVHGHTGRAAGRPSCGPVLPTARDLRKVVLPARAPAARRMLPNRSGVIMTVSAVRQGERHDGTIVNLTMGSLDD